MNEHVFALDIGTRSVTGILLKKQNNTFELVDLYSKEHKERSMHDGQIHNVVAVADVITDVKEALEKNHGKLHRVCVAAAGRSLKTVQSTASIKLNHQPIKNNETIKHLELSAAHTAQLNLSNQSDNNMNYYCVGYSVLFYKLDNEQIGSLIDQSGETASVEIIATFLPSVVVDSLFASLGRAKLEMDALTLEPIAAIDVLIPESMRRLNVALVDIGAGTSDIAITDKGTVVAYGMVPVAGDEITEAISDHYLLDFPLAEQTKLNIVTEGKDFVSDILGFETEITYDTLITDIKDSIEKLAESIAVEILQLNAKAPKAVMLIGGGSLTPDLTTAIAKVLKLPLNRVAVRGIEAIQNLSKTDNLPSGPEFVTPIGIAISSKENPIHYVSVQVNGKPIRMFEIKKLTVGDALIQAGIEITKFYGKPGMAAFIKVNGKSITLPGEYGGTPRLLLNNKSTSVESTIQDGDSISIQVGVNGTTPSVNLEQLMGEIPSIRIYFNQTSFELKPNYYVNNQLKSKEYIVQDKDSITIWRPETIHDFLTSVSTDKLPSLESFSVVVNQRNIHLETGETHILLNGKPASYENALKQDDQLNISYAKEPTVIDLLHQIEKDYWASIDIQFNTKPVTIKQKKLKIIRDGVELDKHHTLKAHDRLECVDQKVNPFIFQDVFRYVDLDLTNARGNFRLYKNNDPSSFDDIIENGDQLTIEWGVL